MRRVAVLSVSTLFLFAGGCGDGSTALGPDLSPSFAKGGKPGKPSSDPANPVLAIDGGGLWVADEDGGHKTMIHDPGYRFDPSWFPGGDGTPENPHRIMISGWFAGQLPMQIVEVIVEGGVPTAGSVTEVLPEAIYGQPKVSPDGSQVVAVNVGGAPDFHHSLSLVNLETLQDETIYVPSSPGNEVFRPEWSRSGEFIVFFEATPDWPQENTIWLLNPETEVLKEILTFTAYEGSPRGLSWARLSDQLAFDYDGVLRYVALDENNDPIGEPVEVGEGRGPVWSPDDTRIAYERRNTIYVKTLWAGARKDPKVLGGWWPDWRR